MNKKCAWCWIVYAVPCLFLLGWYATGHEPGSNLSLLVWIYGFPSTALLLPVASLIWELNPSAEFVVTTLIAMVANGATWAFILRLVRENSVPERGTTEAAGKQT